MEKFVDLTNNKPNSDSENDNNYIIEVVDLNRSLPRRRIHYIKELVKNKNKRVRSESFEKEEDLNLFQPVERIMAQNLVSGLEKPIDKNSKGFKMLAKFGFKEGQPIGKNGRGLIQPLNNLEIEHRRLNPLIKEAYQENAAKKRKKNEKIYTIISFKKFMKRKIRNIIKLVRSIEIEIYALMVKFDKSHNNEAYEEIYKSGEIKLLREEVIYIYDDYIDYFKESIYKIKNVIEVLLEKKEIISSRIFKLYKNVDDL